MNRGVGRVRCLSGRKEGGTAVVLEWPSGLESAGLQTSGERVQVASKDLKQLFIDLASLSLSCCSFHSCRKSLVDVVLAVTPLL